MLGKPHHPKWVGFIKTMLAPNPQMLDYLVKQLEPHFKKRVGIPFDPKQAIFFPGERDQLEVMTNGNLAWIDGMLNYYNLAGVARIAWYDPNVVKPIGLDTLPTKDLVFWWDFLDIGSIREAIDGTAGGPVSPIPPGRFAFPIEWLVYPSTGVHWTVTFWAAPEQAEKASAVIADAQNTYNEATGEEIGGLIHNLDHVTELEPGKYSFSADYGSAGHWGLQYLLDALHKALPIEKIEVRS